MTKFKLYYDKDEEQKWLHQMCENGYSLTNFFAGFYTFEKCEPGEYFYQIDLFDSKEGTFENYCQFMEESGVTVIQRWFKWVFLRKPADEGAFELYTDTDSLVEHYTRIKHFLGGAFILEMACCLYELWAAIYLQSYVFGILFLFLLVLSGMILKTVWKCDWIIKQHQANAK